MFEGIRERYDIPGDAVLACEVESIVPGTGLHVTVLRARRADKAPETDIGSSCWEVPLYAKPTAWGNNHRADRLRRAEELRGRILALMSMV